MRKQKLNRNLIENKHSKMKLHLQQMQCLTSINNLNLENQ